MEITHAVQGWEIAFRSQEAGVGLTPSGPSEPVPAQAGTKYKGPYALAPEAFAREVDSKRIGVPAVDVIDLSNFPYWHTPEDTLDKVSPRSMAIVGHVILESVQELEKKKYARVTSRRRGTLVPALPART